MWLRAPGLSLIALAILLMSCGGNKDASEAAGSDATPLAEAPCVPRPAGAAHGTRALFNPAYIDSYVWLADSDGGSQRQLIFGANPQWSPDGQSIIFADGTFDGLHFRGRLCVVRPDGTGLRQLGDFFRGDTRSSCAGGTPYSWSRDAATLIYESDESTYMAPLDDPRAAARELFHGVISSLSPDGRTLAFSASEPVENQPLGQVLYCGVWVSSAQGNNRRFLFPHGTSPAFSPDGTRIAYVDGPRVMVGDANGGSSVVAAQMSAYETYDVIRRLAWSPGGQRLAFPYDSPGDGGPVVYVVDANGGGEPAEIGEGAELAWSPDSKQLLLSKYDGSLFVADASGDGEPENIGVGHSPSWSPDGTAIAFSR